MKSWRAKISLFLVVGIFTGVFTGCNSSVKSDVKAVESKQEEKKETKQEASQPKKDVTLSVGSSAGWLRDVDKKLAEDFTKESGIKIEFLTPADDQYATVLKSKLSIGEGPDVFLTESGTGMYQYLPDRNFVDLSNEAWASRLVEWAKTGSSYKGKLVGLNLWSADGWGILYNTGIFEKNGLSVPKDYKDFLNVCEALKAKGITPIYELGKDQWHQGLWLNTISYLAGKNNPGLYDKLNSGEAKLADLKECKLVLSHLKEIVDKGYFGKNFMSNTWDKAIEAMGSEKYAMCLVYTTFQNEVMEKFPQSGADKWKMFASPLGDNKGFASSSGGIIHVINKNSKYLEEAMKYFEFLTRAENIKTFYAGRADLGPTSFKDIEGKMTESFKSVMEYSTDGAGLDFETGILFFDTTMVGKFVQEMYLGSKTPEQVLQAVDKEREKSLKTIAK